MNLKMKFCQSFFLNSIVAIILSSFRSHEHFFGNEMFVFKPKQITKFHQSRFERIKEFLWSKKQRHNWKRKWQIKSIDLAAKFKVTIRRTCSKLKGMSSQSWCSSGNNSYINTARAAAATTMCSVVEADGEGALSSIPVANKSRRNLKHINRGQLD